MGQIRWMHYVENHDGKKVNALIDVDAIDMQNSVPVQGLEYLSQTTRDMAALSPNSTPGVPGNLYNFTPKTREEIEDRARRFGATIIVEGRQKDKKARFREGLCYFFK